MKDWKDCKNILCIRADNMGDVIMSGPAIRALKETFGCKIILLTSTMGAGIGKYMPGVDEVLVCNLPWVKTTGFADGSACLELVEIVKERNFDGAVIFSVYSQNTLPSALLLYLANIPLRLAHCRENPYELLTHWLPDQEPFTFIDHQVERDLKLVNMIGASVSDDRLLLLPKEEFSETLPFDILKNQYVLIHPSVSEEKRMFPVKLWAETLRELRQRTALPFYITGGKSETALVRSIIEEAGVPGCFMLAGKTDLPDFIRLIRHAKILVSVNTSAVHIAAAVSTPVVVLYALTNPQHTPWKVPSCVFYFPVEEVLESKNEIIRYVNRHILGEHPNYPKPESIAEACLTLMKGLPETERQINS